MHLKRQKSTSSRKSEASSKSSKSSKSNKSVRFELVEDVYYTHSPSEYDRSPATEHTARPVLGQLFFIDEKDDYDKALVRNTNNNRHRSFQSAVIHLALRAWRWRVLYFFSHSGIIILSWTKKIILVLPHHTPQLVPPPFFTIPSPLDWCSRYCIRLFFLSLFNRHPIELDITHVSFLI